MSGVVEFRSREVRPLIEHALAAKSHRQPDFEASEGGPASLMLVGDDGIYLMSSGLPGLQREDGTGNVVAYAIGFDPNRDGRDVVWDRKRDVFGGDDGVEFLPMVDTIKRWIAAGEETIAIRVTEESIELLGPKVSE